MRTILVIFLLMNTTLFASGIPRGIRIHFNLTEAQNRFIDEHFDFVMTPSLSAEMRSTFEKARLLLYRSIQGTWEHFTQFDWAHIDSCENMFCHSDSSLQDSSTRIITEWDSQLMEGRDLVEKTAPDALNHWVNYYAVTASTQVYLYNYDGLFIDSASHLLKKSWLHDELPWNYTAESWREGRYKGLAFIKSYLPDKLVIFNGLHSDFGSDSSITLTDGGMWEDFAFVPDSAGTYKGVASWYSAIECMEKNKEKGSLVLTVKKWGLSEDFQTRMFSTASYLLISQPNIFLTLSDYAYHTFPQYYPEFEIDLGNPLQSITMNVDTLFFRKFEHGLVIVNPTTTSTKTFELEKEYYLITAEGGGFINTEGKCEGKLNYEKISGQISLPPISGMVLSDTPSKVKKDTSTPSSFILEQNYPNPFNPTTTISYSIPSSVNNGRTQSVVNVTLTIYNSLGQKVATLVNKAQAPGNYSVQFNASNLPSGVYFYKLQAGNFTSTKKMILMK